MKIDLKITSAV